MNKSQRKFFFISIHVILSLALSKVAFAQADYQYPCPEGVGEITVINVQDPNQTPIVHFNYDSPQQNILNLLVFGPEGLEIQPIDFQVNDVSGKSIKTIPAKKFIPDIHVLTNMIGGVLLSAGTNAVALGLGTYWLNALPIKGQVAWAGVLTFGAIQGAISQAVEFVLDYASQGYFGDAPSFAVVSIPKPQQKRFSIRITPGRMGNTGGTKLLVMSIASKAIIWSPKTVTYFGGEPTVPFPAESLIFFQRDLLDTSVGPLGIEYMGKGRLNINVVVPGQTLLGRYLNLNRNDRGSNYELEINDLDGDFVNICSVTKTGGDLAFCFNESSFRDYINSEIRRSSDSAPPALIGLKELTDIAEDFVAVFLAYLKGIDIQRARDWTKIQTAPAGMAGVFIIHASLEYLTTGDLQRAAQTGLLKTIETELNIVIMKRLFPFFGSAQGARTLLKLSVAQALLGFVIEAVSQYLVGALTESDTLYFDVYQARREGPGRVRFKIRAIDAFLKNKPSFVVLSDSVKRTFNAPSVISIAVDVSSSMNEGMGGRKKIEALNDVLQQMLSVLSSLQDQGVEQLFSLVAFNTSASVKQDMTADIKLIKAAADGLDANGSTNLYKALEKVSGLIRGVQADRKFALLMSDGEPTEGNTDKDSIVSYCQKMRDEGQMTLDTIGFGDPNNMDLDFLCRMAKAGGGSCVNAPDYFGLIGEIQERMISSLSANMRSQQGIISQGETIDLGIYDVPPNTGIVNFSIVWEGSEIELIVFDPSGRRVDDRYPGAAIERTANAMNISVSNPAPGPWKAQARGKSIPRGSERFKYLVSEIEKKEAVFRGGGGGFHPERRFPLELLAVLTLALADMFVLILVVRKRRQAGQGPAVRTLAVLVIAGKSYPMTRSVWKIGRNPACDLIIKDPAVSDFHARIIRVGSGWEIKDLDSRNGTSVNAVRIARPTLLKSGDSVGVAGFLMTFLIKE